MGNGRSPWMLVILLLFGAIVGSIIGDVLGSTWAVLKQSKSIGLQPPITLDLYVFQVTFGFLFKVNLASALGMILAYVFYRRF